MDLIHKLEKARTKDDLEELGIEHLGIDADKRKPKEVLREQLIIEAKAQGWATDESDDAPVAAEPEPVTEPTPAPAERTVRMAKNTKTGRVMQWTAAMAKMSHMKEV